jgi:GNAT superfamily N-acetyltransferase
MTLTLQKERFVAIAPELPELMRQHWIEAYPEAERLPFDPDFPQFSSMDLTGRLHIITVRYDGRLVGYFFAAVSNHLHSRKAKCAWSDMFYIHPDYRTEGRGMWAAGYLLFVEVEKMLRELEVVKCYIVTKKHFPITVIMRRLKFFAVETVWTKLF